MTHIWFIVVVLVAASSATTVNAAANCQGAGFDLSPLAGQDYKQAQTDYNYIMNICGATADPACKGGSLCQYDKSTPPVYKHLMSIWDGTGAWATCVDPVNCPNGGLSVSFKNGDVCTANRAVTFIFACTPGVSTVASYAIAQTTTCVYNNVIPHEIGCSGSSPPATGGGGGSSLTIGLAVGIPAFVLLTGGIACVVRGRTQQPQSLLPPDDLSAIKSGGDPIATPAAVPVLASPSHGASARLLDHHEVVIEQQRLAANPPLLVPATPEVDLEEEK